MAAEIHHLPRFKGEIARKLPSAGEEIPYSEALRILAKRAHEWRDRIQDMLDEGPHFERDDGRDHIMADGATMQAMGEDMQALSKHLHHLAALIDEERGGGEN